ncbi:MAG: type II toxin-antitoxin system prevent-host-death family antitoxin [Litorimonas sp.]
MDTINFDVPVNIHEAKTHFSKLVAAVERGETIVISRYGKPVAQMEPVEAAGESGERELGILRGQITMPEGFDIDTYMEDEVAEMFRGDESKAQDGE